MITDTLENLSRYRGLHPNLDLAIDWLQHYTVGDLPNGRTEVAGEKVFINVMDADLRDAEGAAFEYHRRYADLQIDLTGVGALGLGGLRHRGQALRRGRRRRVRDRARAGGR